MKNYIFILLITTISTVAYSQNQIRIRGGVLTTNTSVAEYNRGLDYFYYDSVTLYSRTTAPQLNVDIDIDLGERFFLSTGLSYSEKGLAGVRYTSGDYWYAADQKYLGMNILLKYHYKFNNEKLGVFVAAGFRSDFAVGGPNNAEIAIVYGAEYFRAFSTYNQIDFSMNTLLGVSYKLGPGDITLDVNFQNGLNDILADQFIVGRTFSIGTSLGYSFYL